MRFSASVKSKVTEDVAKCSSLPKSAAFALDKEEHGGLEKAVMRQGKGT